MQMSDWTSTFSHALLSGMYEQSSGMQCMRERGCSAAICQMMPPTNPVLAVGAAPVLKGHGDAQ